MRTGGAAGGLHRRGCRSAPFGWCTGRHTKPRRRRIYGLLQRGIPSEVWQAAGFTERLEGDGSVIPNYLTPPLLENTEYYYFTNKPENFVLFKADGDQDRPNLK